MDNRLNGLEDYDNVSRNDRLSATGKASQATRGEYQRERSLRPLRNVAISTVNCVLAHWYLMPGLAFHRYGVRLSASTVFRSRAVRRTASRILSITHEATSYLDFDFAWTLLMSHGSLGSYLDVGSPLLFPIVLLSKLRAETAMLLSAEEITRKEILDTVGLEDPESIVFGRTSELSRTANVFDVVTSLCWIGRQPDDVAAVKSIWRRLKPGGMLILSVPCSRVAVIDEARDGPGEGAGANQRPFGQRSYDMQSLKTRIFSVLGEPKRYAIYGEALDRINQSQTSAGLRKSNAWTRRSTITVARGWRRFRAIDDLVGQGIISMKFAKSPAIA